MRSSARTWVECLGLAACAIVASGCAKAPTLFAVCEPQGAAPDRASLVSAIDGLRFATLPPMMVGDTAALTVTVTNTGTRDATDITDATPHSSLLTFTGGTYPGAGGTCGHTLSAGSSCALAVTVLATAAGTQHAFMILTYYDGALVDDLLQDFAFEATTAPFSPAPHSTDTSPQISSRGGPVLPHLQLVTVSFADTVGDSDIDAFGTWIATSDWLATVGADYGAGTGTHRHVLLDDTSPSSLILPDLGRYAALEIAAGKLPAPGDQTIYMFFLSPNTVLQDGKYRGIHSWEIDGNRTIHYAAILPSCADEAPGKRFYTAAHELIESATDPVGNGYRLSGADDEVADVCEGPDIVEDGYMLPLIWSNTRAAAGETPCGPQDGGVTFGVDDGLIGPLDIKAGGGASVTLTGWSSAPVGDWLVHPELEAGSVVIDALDTDLMNNGRTAHLSVGVPPGVAPESEELWLFSRDTDGGVGGVTALPIVVQ